MPITHRDKGASRKWTDEDIAQIEAMNATMSQREIPAHFGVCHNVIWRQLQEHGSGAGKDYKPRVLAPWPKVNFANDNLVVRD